MTDERVLFIVQFERTHDGGCGDVVACTQVQAMGGLGAYQVREEVVTEGPTNPGVNVSVFAATEHEAITEARTRGDAYGRAHSGSR
jgi:hypothetical protein